jgi:mannose/fructose-specific phosphotransferase system component IIA
MSTTGVVVVAHGDSGSSMLDAAERMVGKLNVHAISVRVGEPRESIESRLDTACEQLASEEVLFLVDLEGSTPFNLCCRRCHKKSVVLSGINLPMLFKLATADRQHGALGLAEELRATGVKSIHIRVGQEGSGS